MPTELFQFGLTALVTLTVVVDPFGLVPVFVSMTRAMEAGRRQATLLRAVVIAAALAYFFMIAGRAVLSYLGVTVQAFSISGGILLFITALPMLFGQRPGLQSPEREEQPVANEDVAVFPLAIPLLTGPGTIATILLLTSQANAEPMRLAVLSAAIAVVFLLTLLVLRAGERLVARIGESKVHILTRVMGILLAALAVQFVLNGVTGYLHGLSNP